MNYKIKVVELEDIEDFFRVNNKCWQETYKEIIDKAFLKELSNNLEQNIIKRKTEYEYDPYRFILYLNNEPVGMTSVDKSRIKEFPNSGELCAIYLLEKVKGKGLGKILFEYDVKCLKKMGFNSMVIGCLKDNKRANGFYEHQGGKLAFTRKIAIGGKEYDENVYYFEKI